ncbi:hypothetical protein CCAX7_000560 [Capsulimonas corticalis]|uniref:Uncharacterized protein n=1 Tax=Capsulimonas corticalis TaxID=2219043 RepID=A0A402CRN7_9BACT|nr:YfjI family protein [Capsulimonas corticalis]BDI28005.1 hypothetical protein CCAX7_000560 [Capsulimonas corticalis]
MPELDPVSTSQFNAADVAAWLSVLHAPGEVIEIRVLESSKKTTAGYYDDFAKAAADVRRFDGKCAVYSVLNTVNPSLLGRICNRLEASPEALTSDKDIMRRRWLMVDFDPVRPKGISSTRAEHDAARDRARIVRDYLHEKGFTEPVIADSGNGWHLLYRLDLPNDNETRDLLSHCLEALDLLFGDDVVGVDNTTFNSSRICKLYGTVSTKGDSTPDRPHRRARIHRMPEAPEPVSLALLQELAATLPPTPAAPPRTADAFDLERWIADHNLPVAKTGPYSGGGRKWILNPCPWNGDHTNDAAFIIQFASGAVAAGCRHNGCHGRTWQDLRRMYEPDAYDAPAPHSDASNTPGAPNSAAGSTPDPRRVDQLISGAGAFESRQRRQGAAPEPVAPDEEWECPLPLGEEKLPPFPLHALPPVLASYAKEVAEDVQVPIDITGMLALCVISALNSRRVQVQVGAWSKKHIETVNLYMVVASVAGSGKSPAMKRMAAPIVQIERELRERFEGAHTTAVAKFETDKKRLTALQTKSANAQASARRLIDDEILGLVEEMKEPKALPRMLVQDITMEALFTKLSEQEDNCIANLDTEGGLFSIIKGLYASKNSSPNMDIYLKAWSGDYATNDRVGKGNSYILAPTLTIGLTVQPEIMQSLAEDERLHHNGFLARFLYAVAPNLAGERPYLDEGGSNASEYAYTQTILALHDLPKAITEDAPHKRFLLTMDAEAIAVHKHYHNDINARQRPGQDLAAMLAWSSKLAGNVARIAANLHMVKHVGVQPGSRMPWETPISGETMAQAWEIGTYCIPHAVAAFGLMRSDSIVALARRIIEWIKRKKLNAFTMREIRQALNPESKERIELALTRLMEDAYVRLEMPAKKEGRGRPGKPYYAVNPCVVSEGRQQLQAA